MRSVTGRDLSPHMQLAKIPHAALAALLLCASQADALLSGGVHSDSGQAEAGIVVHLLDARTGRSLADRDVAVRSDDGIRCIRAPCPNVAREWQGRSDARGRVRVPAGLLRARASVSVSGYGASSELVSAAGTAGTSERTAELIPDRPGEAGSLGTRPFKLVDARTGKPLADTAVRLRLGPDDSLRTSTNSLGYLFVPLERALPYVEETWVDAPGYASQQLDFGGARFTTRLERQ